ncbi:hypothetical protein [Aeromicrobium endophyticum]|nr:hypothetical protein [Aeromicrobium endophyticum]
MKTRSRMSGVALALALSLGGTLAACGGSDGSDGSSDKAESTPSATASEPAATEEPTASAAPEGDTGDKPSKEDVVAGYTKVLKSTAGANLPEDIVNKVVTCFADELYDTASTQTLQAIADAQPTNVNPADMQAFTDASTACTKKISGQ